MRYIFELQRSCDMEVSMDNNMKIKKGNVMKNSELHMKQFSVLDVQEKERQRIARDLHDTSLQDLTHLVHKVELSSLYIDQDPVKAKLELATVEIGLHKVIDDIRNRIFDLRPMTFDDFGFRDTLLNLFSVISQDGVFEIISDIDDIEDVICEQLPNEKAKIFLIMIYRIIQECVYNAVEHSKGNQIKIILKQDDINFLINIKDNGVGFDQGVVEKKEKHFGLSVVRERVFLLNGKINIVTENGTSIFIEIPKKRG